jgi:hypothetical protein
MSKSLLVSSYTAATPFMNGEFHDQIPCTCVYIELAWRVWKARVVSITVKVGLLKGETLRVSVYHDHDLQDTLHWYSW